MISRKCQSVGEVFDGNGPGPAEAAESSHERVVSRQTKKSPRAYAPRLAWT